MAGLAAVAAAGVGIVAYLQTRETERTDARRESIERVATDFVDGPRDSTWVDQAVSHYDFPLTEYYDIQGPVDEAAFRAGDARFWSQAEALDFTVTGAQVLSEQPDGSVQVNVQFDAVKVNRADSGICREERASKTVRLTLVPVGQTWLIRSEDDNSASYNCTGDS